MGTSTTSSNVTAETLTTEGAATVGGVLTGADEFTLGCDSSNSYLTNYNAIVSDTNGLFFYEFELQDRADGTRKRVYCHSDTLYTEAT